MDATMKDKNAKLFANSLGRFSYKKVYWKRIIS